MTETRHFTATKRLNYSMRCLVLGGRGFMGSHLIDALLAKGHIVRCFDRPNVIPLGETHLSNPSFELYEGDLASEADATEAVQGCNVCFHLVSTTIPKSSNDDPAFDVATNLLATVRLLTQAVKAGVQEVIFISSGGTVYGIPEQVPIPESHPTDPLCSYGITKLAIEKYLHLFKELHGLNYKILRVANPFGERQRTLSSQGSVAVFLGKALKGEAIEIWGDGSIVRDYIYVGDVVRAMLAAMEYMGEEHVFNIGSGQGLSINEVLDAIERITRRPTMRNYLPGRQFDVPASVLNIERATKALRWVPRTGFEEGLARFTGWLLEHPETNISTGA